MIEIFMNKYGDTFSTDYNFACLLFDVSKDRANKLLFTVLVLVGIDFV